MLYQKNILHCFLFSFSLLFTACSLKQEPIPEFKFFTTQRQWLTTNDVVQKNVVLVYFNSGCEFCQNEIYDLQQHNAALKQKNVQCIFISLESLESLQEFTQAYAYDTIANWTFAHVSPVFIDSVWNTQTVPSIFIYKKGYLLEKSVGQLPAEDILSEF
jgi:thioredoxin-related protein